MIAGSKDWILHAITHFTRRGKGMCLFASMSIFIVLLFVFSGSCLAESLQYCQEFPLASADWSDNLSLQKFDSSLGKLTGAQISMNFTLVHDFGVSNRRDLPNNASIAAGANLSLHLPDKKSLVVKSAKNWTVALEPKKEKSLHESDEQFDSFSLDSNQLGDFVSSSSGDSLNLPIDASIVVSLSSDAAASFDTNTLAGASVCIIYEYIPSDAGKSEVSKNSIDSDKDNREGNI